MYRLERRLEVAYGRARDLLDADSRIRALAGERGWRIPTLWNVSFGPINVFVATTDYDTLADYERENIEQLADAAWMNAIRAMNDFTVQGTASTELRETIAALA